MLNLLRLSMLSVTVGSAVGLICFIGNHSFLMNCSAFTSARRCCFSSILDHRNCVRAFPDVSHFHSLQNQGPWRSAGHSDVNLNPPMTVLDIIYRKEVRANRLSASCRDFCIYRLQRASLLCCTCACCLVLPSARVVCTVRSAHCAYFCVAAQSAVRRVQGAEPELG